MKTLVKIIKKAFRKPKDTYERDLLLAETCVILAFVVMAVAAVVTSKF